jgi:hypothetical protein
VKELIHNLRDGKLELVDDIFLVQVTRSLESEESLWPYLPRNMSISVEAERTAC